MQAESGQALDAIVKRKDRERRVNNGVFYWGIGNALGSRIGSLLTQEPNPRVYFSVMLSRPKAMDAFAESVVAWTKAVDASGNQFDLPDSILVLSRASTALKRKESHFALVCASESELTISPSARIDACHLWNIGEQGRRVGAS